MRQVSLMNNKRLFRNGSLGLPQIMATLLVVLPTLAFIVVILLDYWSAMQADYKLKLIANLTSDFLISREDLRDFSDSADYDNYLTRVNSLCPNQTNITFPTPVNAANSGEIDVTVQYTYTGTYLKNKTITTQMNTYSYVDQNGSVVITCE
ncbi:hypothetical protein [Sulfurimonas marina]|uniref:Pilus assembly protein n=1 Tax=Sulfurimonas marina TaxID=2590551 RepID=A0A7M1AXR4_9BACT|nr:hypothetical protein [Sulfurimonas marina]QOP42205.1 hypothetical protein FJR03_10840 [Sulfurimonas marina]